MIIKRQESGDVVPSILRNELIHGMIGQLVVSVSCD